MIVIKEPIEFEWDKGNIDKNQKKHDVSEREAEEAFFDKKKVIFKDKFHSEREDRFILVGITNTERLLYTVFTKRNGRIRIISARDINKRELFIYDKKINTTKI